MIKQQKILDTTICYHCGEEVMGRNYILEDKHFCCAGCLGVYQILSSNNLCAYYAYNETPGKKSLSTGYFEYLDEPNIIKQLIDYQDEKSTIVTFFIPAIHCSSCIWLLEHLYKVNAAIFNSRIDFLKKQVTISFRNKDISLKKLVEILVNIGYEPAINLQDVVKEKSHSVNKSLILKIAVAGFCMGNVMLFSFPEYFGLSGLEKQFQVLFGWLNLTLSIPVVLYCGQEYFTSAWNSLKHKHVNLDTPLALIIAVLFLRTAYSVILNTGPGFADTLTGLVFLLLMGKWVKQRTYHHISFDRDYRSYFPIAITTLVDGKEKPKAINELVIGDRIWIRNSELIPADSILMKGNAWLDMSFVTGETEPQQKVLGEIVYAGGKQMGEGIELEVVKVPSQSYLTGLWNKEHYSNDFKQHFNDSVAKYFSIAVFVIAFAAMGYWFFYNNSGKAWAAFTAVIIVACPCVLALSTPFTLSAILAVFDKKGFYVKNTDAVEDLAKCNSIVFDKTGTLTTTENAKISFTGTLNDEEHKLIVSLLTNSSHPLSRQILKSLGYGSFYPISKYNEIPGKGIRGLINNQMVYAGNESILPFNIKAGKHKGVHIVINSVYKGTFVVEQQWREGLPNLVSKLEDTFSLSVLSGDTAKDRDVLKSIFLPNVTIAFEQSPHDKLEAILNKQKNGEKVIMLGDGLNDAGALKQSDFGIAITDNINNFTPGCDAILKGNALTFLPNFHQLSKDGLKVIKISFAIAISYNCIGLFYAVQGTLYPLVAAVLMPISTITIISFTSIATRFFARKNRLL
ncbi:heavy metal translocating P-type ATPase [Pedobacter boryungensis]|uniref:Heavy metal translocating P-type ATPase metal-binding domain-containing protein n=1 Tax=Pedobacter boryungensis TaxID=869962 RepID=A0ABX2DF52_9SPHI|nr:heavy metal translocating P-type ATPase metal-binding domain-containing protein [Pedobacter boryungensis]NQX31601.1 heavy metal translocating P-type ATPase metal-binding domain-containing protein [Pedobacter boryungensis]